ncbi:hypothetical protein [Streptomyces meridianus]|uniref:DUF3558 domain-containing protein n=1 Tax=Streptomyces meridianus TaxID=2938945 RepID=A0ABT0X6Y3_9ACTN|nr:hypothetical protein [Streptomyces meridianus]MCM2578291.1 hypothetical protein [Streptomyces meridianus]
MQPKAYAAGAALSVAALLIGLTGCSSEGSGGVSGEGSASDGTATVTTDAEPGKHRSLPQACGSIPRGTLRALLPGIQELDGSERKKAYQGEPAVTYDTDRSSGCQWKAEGPAASHHINVDFERVVSYDPAVSDDDRAQELYDKMAAGAGIPAVPDTAEPDEGEPSASASESAVDDTADKASGTPEHPEGAEKPESGKNGKTSEGGDSGTSAPDDTADPRTAPRALDELGDVAYLDDSATESGLHRGITIVFRSSNVITTVEYHEWATPQGPRPASQDLQEKAQRLARELAATLGD